MRLTDDPIYRSMLRLRQDALDMGMYDLAQVYGWSAIRIADHIMMRNFGEIFQKMKGVEHGEA